MFANYHTHTRRCGHAAGEDVEYVEAAIEAGYRELGFSDHCPWIYRDSFVSGIRMRASEVDSYFDSLLKLRQEYKRDIRIFIGFEAEYMPPLMEAQTKFLADYPVDYMILGQHFVGPECNQNYAGRENTDEHMLTGYVDLCLEGMKTGKYLYLAHPDLIYYSGPNDLYEREMRRLCLGMKEMDGAVEMNVLGLINGRNYPDERFWRIARDIGNKVIIGMDAHSPEGLFSPDAVREAERLLEGMERFTPVF